jgi:hypothetical protein
MAYTQKLRLPDGQELALYNEGNTSQGSIRMDGESLTIAGAHSNVAISAGANLIFMGSTATIGGTSSILSLGNSGDTVALNVPGVTYQIGTVTGDTTFANDLTVSGTFRPATITGTVVVTDAVLSWSRDTDYATLSYIDYGADNDQLTLDVGDRQTDYFRIRGANASGTLTNVIDFSSASVTSYVTVNAPTLQENGTSLSSKYLGLTATAADSSKLGGVAASSFLRNDVAGTINGNLTVNGTVTVGANSIIGSNSSYYLSLSSGGVTLSSVGSLTVVADSDNSSTTEYLSLKAGVDDLRVVSDGTITFNGNKVWHAGNDGSGSGLDADTVDGIQGVDIVSTNTTIITTQDWNSFTSNGIYRVQGYTGLNAPSAYTYGTLEVIVSGNSVTQNYYTHNNGSNTGLFTRTKWNASDWSSWKKVWTDDNDGSGSGLDADTVDNVHASSFMRSDQNTSTTGTVTIGTGTTSVLANQTDGSLRVSNTNGYIDIAPKNVSYAHIYTDRPSFYFNKDLLVNGSTVWHSGNDGSTSGLDADMVDGVHLSGLVQTSRTLTPGTGIQIDSAATAKDLTANRTISFDTTWGDGRYLGLHATADNSAKLNGQSASYYSRKLSASYTSVTGDDGTDGWYTLFTVGDNTNTPVQCMIRAYAHSSAAFIVSKGYSTSNAQITVLNANTSSINVGYKYIKGLRVLTDGTVQVKLNGGASVQIDVQLFTSGNETIPAATLVKDTTASPSIAQNIDPLVNGSIVSLGDHYVGTNKVWHQGNDGSGSGLDADTVDGIEGASIVQTSRTVTAGTGLSGGGALSGNITLSLNTTYTDGLYLGKTAKAADSDKLDNLDSSQFVRSDADSTVRGNLIIDTQMDTRYLYVTRSGSTAQEYARHGVSDGAYNIWYNNDEASSVVQFTLDNTDTEANSGAGANTTVFKINGSSSPSLTLNNNVIWHQGNDGSGSGLDADKLDGIESSQFLRSDQDDTITGALTISKATQYPLTLSGNGIDVGKIGIAFNGQSTGLQQGYLVGAFGDGDTMTGTGYAFRVSSTEANTDFILEAGGGNFWVGSNKVWHAGNDGAGSGLDADTLDGINSTGFGQNIASAASDLNTATQSGFYRLNTTHTNAPSNAAYGQMLVMHGGGDTITQILGAYNTTEMYFRSGNPTDVGGTGTWKSWARIWNDQNDGSGSGLDADTVDGIQASQFLRSDVATTLTGGVDLRLKAATGSTDSGDLVFQQGDGTENARIYAAPGTLTLSSGTNTDAQLVITDTTITYNTNKVWHAGNDGASSGLDADLLDGLNGSSYMRSDTNTSTSGTLSVTGLLTATGNISVPSAPYISGATGSWREGGQLNFASRFNGKILNRNADFIQNNMTGFGDYQGSSTRNTRAIVSDDTIPNSTGKLMRVTYDAGASTTAPSTGYGGFTISISRTTGNPTGWGYRAGNRIMFRLVANIPSGKNIGFGTNTVGTGYGGKWLTSTAGTGNWQEYVYLFTTGITGTFLDTGYFYIAGTPVGTWTTWAASTAYTAGANVMPTTKNGFYYTATAGTSGATQPTWPTTDLATVVDGGVTWTAHKENFTWDVAICEAIDMDAVADVDRAPMLNVGYKSGVDIGWGEIYSTGKITSDSNIYGSSFYPGTSGAYYSKTGNSWFNPLNASSNMHIYSGEGNKALYVDADSINLRNTAGTNRLTISSAGAINTYGATTVNADLTVTGNLSVNKTNGWAYLYFPRIGNDPGFIGHYENTTTSVSEMRFSVSDDADGTDYFTFGANTGQSSANPAWGINSGTFVEGARIGSNGVATFKGLTVNGTATITGNVTMNGQLSLDGGNADGLAIGGNKIQEVGTGELVILTDELRLGTAGAAWDYNKWAGFRYDAAITTLSIGGPAAGASLWNANANPSRITLAMVGTDAVTMDGKVTINPVNAASIGLSTMANAHLLLGTTTSGMAFDTNEIAVIGNTMYIETLDSSPINIAPNAVTTLAVTTSGISVTGTASVSGNSTLTGLVTATNGVNIPSGQSLYVGTNGSSTASFRFHYNGSNSYLDYNTDLYFRAGTAEKMRIDAAGKVGIGVAPDASYLLNVNSGARLNGSIETDGANNGLIFPSGKKIYSNGTDNWIRIDSDFFASSFILRTDGQLHVGSSGSSLYVDTSTFNWKNTLWSNTVGVAVGKTSLSNAAILDVYTTSTSGINLQRSAQTIAPGITFQNSTGEYNAWIAPTASATPDLVVYSKGTSATLSTANIQETARFTNGGNFQLKGDMYFSGGGNQKIHGVNEISLDWTGANDDASKHGIQSHAEDGTQSGSVRLNSMGDIIMTIDTDVNSTSKFIVQKESTTNGTDIFSVDENGFGTFASGAVLSGDVSLNSASGRGFRFWNSDSYKIYMSSSTDATWGKKLSWIPTDAANADYYIYSRIEGGNRGWAFRNDNKGGVNAAITGDGQFHTNKGVRAQNYSMEYNTTEDSLDFIYWG